MDTTQSYSSISGLPIQLGIRLALDAVSYSNPLPEWFDPITVNYSAREATIKDKIRAYFSGQQPKPPFGILVPKRSGVAKLWSVPTVNDQIILQSCVSAIAEQLDLKCLDEHRIFSYRYNRDPNRLALVEDQIGAWSRFQNETNQRCNSSDCILQIDLEDAFGHIDRRRFIEFLKSVIPGTAITDLLGRLLEALALDQGLPLVNDSVFFLGNAYLSEVDKIVSRHTADYIRFVDDYRIFGPSRDKLESVLTGISGDLQSIGFQVNSQKVKMGSGQEYLNAISQLKYATKNVEVGYVSTVIFRDVVTPKDLVAVIDQTLSLPDERLNEGLGRYQLAALRRLRSNAVVAEGANFQSTPIEDFSELLSTNAIVEKVTKLLKTYSATQSESWRTIWLLYLRKDFSAPSIPDRRISTQLDETVRDIANSPSVAPAVRFWARGISSRNLYDQIDLLHELDYVQQGALCCGVPNA
jgi:hypothetical protein